MPAIQELKDTCEVLKVKLNDLGNKYKNGEAWQGEDEATWKALNTDYDNARSELDTEIDAINAATKRGNDIATRLAAVNSSPADLEALIGRDGGSIQDGPVNKDRFLSGPMDGSFYANQSIALQGWMLNSQGMRNRITERHISASRAVGCRLDDGEFMLNIGSTDSFKMAQANHKSNSPRNAMTVGTGGTGGFTVGQTLMTSLEKATLDFSGVLQACDVIRTDTGEPFYWPTIDDTGNTGSRVGEGADAGTAADPSVGRLMWSAFDYTSGLLNVSRNLLTDSFVSWESEIGTMLGTRLGRKQNTDFTTGGGGGLAPRGIVTASVLGVTAGSATAITWDEIIDLEHSVDPSRRNEAGYMLHDTILAALRKLKDGNGQYLWQSNANSGTPDTINARPYWINQAMASAMASAAKTLLFGQFKQYKVRQVGQLKLQRLVERRAEFNQDVFIAYMRADGNLLDAGDNPVKHLVH